MPNAVLRRVAVHDRYQLELKLGYPLTHGQATRYRIDTYIFAPQSLGITEMTYPRSDFYRDIQHYMRMKTPRFQLEQLVSDQTSPLCQSEELLQHAVAPLDRSCAARLDTNFRLLRAILKSTVEFWIEPLLRPGAQPTDQSAALYDQTLTTLLTQLDAILACYRGFGPLLEAVSAPAALLPCLSPHRRVDQHARGRCAPATARAGPCLAAAAAKHELAGAPGAPHPG